MKILILLCLLCKATSGFAQTQPVTIYLIRHAEKADGSSNPDLSPAGEQRALNIAKHFETLPVELFYSTPYKRTQQTCSPAASGKKREIITYAPDQIDLRTIAAANPGKSILIVGHSNTIPAYINKLIGKRVYEDIPEAEFDHLYIVTIDGDTIEHTLNRL